MEHSATRGRSGRTGQESCSHSANSASPNLFWRIDGSLCQYREMHRCLNMLHVDKFIDFYLGGRRLPLLKVSTRERAYEPYNARGVPIRYR